MTQANYSSTIGVVDRARPPETDLDPKARLLVGDLLIDAIRKASPGRMIGVRLATLAGHLIVGLGETGDGESSPPRESVYTRLALFESLPTRDAGLNRLVERGLANLCGVQTKLIQCADKHERLIRVDRKGAGRGTSRRRDRSKFPEAE